MNLDLDSLISKLEADLAAARRLRASYGVAPPPSTPLSETPKQKHGNGTHSPKSDEVAKREKWHKALADAMSGWTSVNDALATLKEGGISLKYGTAYVYLRRAVERHEYEFDKKEKRYRYKGTYVTGKT